MENEKQLYLTALNPLLIKPERGLPNAVAVIGAGTIGPDIGYYLKSAMPGITLFLVDIDELPLQKAEKRLAAYAQKAVNRKKMGPKKAAAVLNNIIYTQDYSDIKGCELVIEAATENIPLKQKIFENVENIVSPDTIITSNTSSIPSDRLFSRMQHPERTTVTHFFAPAWRSLPVEIIQWDQASQATVDYLFWFFASTGKAPIITGNAICFVLDRIFDNWCNESAGLLGQATASQIDKVAEAFVFAGPFFVLNMANGNPIIVETNTLQMEEGTHYQPAAILNSVDRWTTHRPGSKVDIPDDLSQKIRDRLLGILFSQSFDIIDRGIGTPADLNFGCQVALGFKKGPLDIMRDLGEKEVSRIMARFEKDRPGFPQAKAPLAAYQQFYRYVLTDDIDGVRVITLRRPQAMNALNDEITGEILDVMQADENNPAIKGFIITGYGTQAFSAGADIGKFPEMLGDTAASVQYAKDCAKVQIHMDRMEKPVVAALNGLAMGGGFEVAIRCHSMVAVKKATLQFPEIGLGILPGLGGCVVPYRKWPAGAALFHDMIMLGKPITAREAADIGMINQLVENPAELIPAAVAEIDRIRGDIPRIMEQAVDIPEFTAPDPPMSGRQVLSREAITITAETVKKGAAAASLHDALEIGYAGFGRIACTDAAKEGIGAFLQKRRPEFTK
ncbi:MAG: enoyl-CoA hydratase/isomerase family protein [Deltaproteobacteria bacterium]|nr:enoyl-CoA hydratase/isomerase family protein [Deltaproteobacteria bacterium]